MAYADEVILLIFAKHLEEIEHPFDMTFEEISRWMNDIYLEVAKHKSLIELIPSWKREKTSR